MPLFRTNPESLSPGPPCSFSSSPKLEIRPLFPVSAPGRSEMLPRPASGNPPAQDQGWHSGAPGPTPSGIQLPARSGFQTPHCLGFSNLLHFPQKQEAKFTSQEPVGPAHLEFSFLCDHPGLALLQASPSPCCVSLHSVYLWHFNFGLPSSICCLPNSPPHPS